MRDSPVEEGQEVVVAPPVEAPHPLTVFQDNWRGKPPSRLLPQGQKILMGRMGQACCDNPVWHGFNRNPGAFPHIFNCGACDKFFVRNWVMTDQGKVGGQDLLMGIPLGVPKTYGPQPKHVTVGAVLLPSVSLVHGMWYDQVVIRTLQGKNPDILTVFGDMPNTAHPEFKDRWNSLFGSAVVDVNWDHVEFIKWWMQTYPEWEANMMVGLPLERLLPARSQFTSILPR